MFLARKPPRPSPWEAGRNIIDDDHQLLDLAAEATPRNARRLRVRFEEWLRTAGVPAALVGDLTLAVYEAIANVVEHAYHPGHPDRLVHLRVQLHHDQVLITVSDQGCWRTPGEPGYRGRGLEAMRYLAADVHLYPTPRGTIVRLRVPLH